MTYKHGEMSHGELSATHLQCTLEPAATALLRSCSLPQIANQVTYRRIRPPTSGSLPVDMQSTCMQPEITVRSSVSVSRNSTHRGSFLPCKQCRRSIAHSDRRVLRVAAQQQQQEQKPAVAKFADSVGLPTEEGLFGFKPFPEVCKALFTRCGYRLTR